MVVIASYIALFHIIVKLLTLVFQREEEINSATAAWQH